jgi:glutamate carboxypeptidase
MRGLRLSIAAFALATGAVATAGTNASVGRLRAAATQEEATFLRTLEQLVMIDSGSDDHAGLALVADLLMERLRALDMDPKRQPKPPAAGDVITGTITGRGGSSFLLLAHYDTVYPAGTTRSWPFRIEGARMFGPGVVDTKGGVVTILSALKVLKTAGFDRFGRITVLFNPDEEIGSVGSHAMITEMAAGYDYTLSAEPGGTQRLLATSGTGMVTMTVAGAASHAGVAPEAGRNALVEMADVVARTRDWSQPLRGLKFNWTTARSGSKRNVIPDKADAFADIRYLHREDVEALKKRLDGLSVAPAVDGTRVTFDLTYMRPPLLPTPQARALAELSRRAGDEIGYPVKIVDQAFGGASDAAFAAVSGKSVVVESYGLLGGGGHTITKEYAERASVVPAIYNMARTIMLAAETRPGRPAAH